MLDSVPRPPQGRRARGLRVLVSPWARLALLVALLATAGVLALVFHPQRLLSPGWPPGAGGVAAIAVFALVYGVCAAAFVPRPLLNVAAGALLGPFGGLAAALAGTVLGAGAAFALGRLLGQDALRVFVRGRWLTAADRLMTAHGFRSMLALRLFPGVPFAAANYGAAVSRMGWRPFVLATGLGSAPNTAAYTVAGSAAASPLSPVFLASSAFIVVSGAVAAVVAWRRRHHLVGPAPRDGGRRPR